MGRGAGAYAAVIVECHSSIEGPAVHVTPSMIPHSFASVAVSGEQLMEYTTASGPAEMTEATMVLSSRPRRNRLVTEVVCARAGPARAPIAAREEIREGMLGMRNMYMSG